MSISKLSRDNLVEVFNFLEPMDLFIIKFVCKCWNYTDWNRGDCDGITSMTQLNKAIDQRESFVSKFLFVDYSAALKFIIGL